MIRKNILTRALIGMLAIVLTAPVAVLAQPDSNAQGVQGQGAPQVFSEAQLDQMLAPIALYPDSLLAQVLLASTYPSQVVEADRWVRAHRGWSKARINDALDNKDWDLSVKALVPFPKVLAMMDKHLTWTTNLGEAFLAQQDEVMARVQELRQRAYAKGNLETTPQQRVVVERQNIQIEPVNPEVIYVPYYDPWQVYGNWWWPGYPPFVFYPYAEPYVTSGLFGFTAGIGVGPYWNWGWGHWNWHHRRMFVNVDRFANINGRHPGFHRHFRTARFHSYARHQVPGLGRMPGRFGYGHHHGYYNRPSSTEVRRGLSRHRNGGFGEHRRGAFSHGARPGGVSGSVFGYTNRGFSERGHSGGFGAHNRGSFSHGARGGSRHGAGTFGRASGHTNRGFAGRGHSGGSAVNRRGSSSHGTRGGVRPGGSVSGSVFGYTNRGSAGHGRSGGFGANRRGSSSHGARGGARPGGGVSGSAFGHANRGSAGQGHSGGFGAHRGGSPSHGAGGGAPHRGVGGSPFGYTR